jgi:hypothetical protein
MTLTRTAGGSAIFWSAFLVAKTSSCLTSVEAIFRLAQTYSRQSGEGADEGSSVGGFLLHSKSVKYTFHHSVDGQRS